MLLALFGFLAVLNLVASGVENDALEWATKPFLMPVLALWAWRAGRNRLLITGLLFSAGGDIALLSGDETGWFITGMVLFLGAHLCYIRLFWKRPNPFAAVAYGLAFAAALAWLWKPLGALAIPMTFYGLALATMATLAAGMGWKVAVGGGLFLLSDLLIAVRVAVRVAEAATLPGPPIWVMLTYLAGQFLIATGAPDRPR